VSIALYRRFRPEAFNEVIGQEQVTVPLMAALRAGKVNHAYLFSGPRGCGKTTSARILARTLNCHANSPENPIDTPCGVCESCVELSRLGSGSLDVVEIDAASHGGVDDARDLRERVTFSPVRDRYKIVIIDEAHMVSPQGFNALLKVVEEPPPHIKFIFATTEPDKVLGTIKSRTHHYPFRLVPSEVLAPYLEQLAAQEGAALGPGVTPLVIKAGGGSVRDSLSVLDQLIAGSIEGEVSYDRAVGLLGYTPAAMLDEAVDALGAHDGGSLFNVIDRAMETGNPPQRFAEDLLQRFRDLIVVSVTGDGAAAVFRDWTPDEVATAQAQAAKFDLGTLTRLGETISTGLGTMVGATSPRLQLELLCARLLIPIGPEQLAARLTSLEKTIATGAIPVIAAPNSSSALHSTSAPILAIPGHSAVPGGGAQNLENAKSGQQSEPAASLSPRARAAARLETASQPQVLAPLAQVSPPTQPAPVAPTPVQPATPAVQPPTSPVQSAKPEAPQAPIQHPPVQQQPSSVNSANTTLELLKAEWPDIVASIPSPVTKSMVASSFGPVAFAEGVLQIGFANETMVGRIAEPKAANILDTVLSEKLGVPVTVRGVLSQGAAPSSGARSVNSQSGTPPRNRPPGNPSSGNASPGNAPNGNAPTGNTPARSETPQATQRTAAASAPVGRSPKPVDESWQQADAAWLAGEAIPLKIPAADPVTQPNQVTQASRATTGSYINPYNGAQQTGQMQADQVKPNPETVSVTGNQLGGVPADSNEMRAPQGDAAASHLPALEQTESVAAQSEPQAVAYPAESHSADQNERQRQAEPLHSVNRKRTAASEDEADPDDAVADQTFLSGVPLVVEMLSGTVISEEPL